MSIALVDWSSVAQCGWWDGAPNTSSTPLVRPGSNIMLRLLTLTFSQPGYRLLMLTDTVGQRAGTLGLARPVPPSLCPLSPPPCRPGGVCVSLAHAAHQWFPGTLCWPCSLLESFPVPTRWTASPRLAHHLPPVRGRRREALENNVDAHFPLHCLLLFWCQLCLWL